MGGVPPSQVMVVRVYVTESKAHVQRLLTLLHESGLVRGVTVFRGVAGFGSTTFMGMDDENPDRDMPVIFEFFDSPKAVEKTIERVRQLIAPHHIVVFPAELHSLKP